MLTLKEAASKIAQIDDLIAYVQNDQILCIALTIGAGVFVAHIVAEKFM